MVHHTLPPLPYGLDALEPHMSRTTMELHYGKHHATYVNKLNDFIAGTPLAEKSLEDTVRSTAIEASQAPVFNNAAQIWNHNLFWQCMKPGGGGNPSGALAAGIDAAFGDFAAFKKQFVAAGVAQFGSGWAWLVLDGDELKITKTSNADNPLTSGQKALLGIDVWEHAYYIDYQNRRPEYINSFLDDLLNWDFVAANYAAAR